MSELPPTPRSTARRRAHRASHHRCDIDAVIAAAPVAHIGVVDNGLPLVIHANAWTVDDRLCVHFARDSRIAVLLAAGAEICVTLTAVDGLVLARSAMHHSMNYRSAMLFGRAHEITDPGEKAKLLLALVDRLVPGRAAQVRPPEPKELAATAVFALPITEGSAKTRSGPPTDRTDDLDRPVWGGVVPLALVAGAPQPDEHCGDGLACPVTAFDAVE